MASSIHFLTPRLEERQCFESRFATLEQQAADQVGCVGSLNGMNFGGKRWVPWDAKASWRSAAEKRLREMTCRSEKLERDRCHPQTCFEAGNLRRKIEIEWRCQGLRTVGQCDENEWREECFGG